jgi:hypothetical protein
MGELRAKGFTQYKAGYLPYSIVDGGQQIRKDFANWQAPLATAHHGSLRTTKPSGRGSQAVPGRIDSHPDPKVAFSAFGNK